MCFSTTSHLGQSSGEITGLPMQQNHTDCTGVAQHALVLGSSGNVQSDPTVSAQPAKSSVSAIQPRPAQEPVKVKVGVLRPVQQPRSYWDRSSELPLVGLEPTEVTAYD